MNEVLGLGNLICHELSAYIAKMRGSDILSIEEFTTDSRVEAWSLGILIRDKHRGFISEIIIVPSTKHHADIRMTAYGASRAVCPTEKDYIGEEESIGELLLDAKKDIEHWIKMERLTTKEA